MLLTAITTYWMLLTAITTYWMLLTAITTYWMLLTAITTYWMLLTAITTYWMLLTAITLPKVFDSTIIMAEAECYWLWDGGKSCSNGKQIIQIETLQTYVCNLCITCVTWATFVCYNIQIIIMKLLLFYNINQFLLYKHMCIIKFKKKTCLMQEC